MPDGANPLPSSPAIRAQDPRFRPNACRPNSRQAFEAAGRHESFLEAVAEQSVTSGSISRHVRPLERYLGTELFLRRSNGVALTAAGKDYAETVSGLCRYRDLSAVLLDHDVPDNEVRARRLQSGPDVALQEDQHVLENWTRGARKARFLKTSEQHGRLNLFAASFP